MSSQKKLRVAFVHPDLGIGAVAARLAYVVFSDLCLI